MNKSRKALKQLGAKIDYLSFLETHKAIAIPLKAKCQNTWPQSFSSYGHFILAQCVFIEPIQLKLGDYVFQIKKGL